MDLKRLFGPLFRVVAVVVAPFILAVCGRFADDFVRPLWRAVDTPVIHTVDEILGPAVKVLDDPVITAADDLLPASQIAKGVMGDFSRPAYHYFSSVPIPVVAETMDAPAVRLMLLVTLMETEELGIEAALPSVVKRYSSLAAHNNTSARLGMSIADNPHPVRPYLDLDETRIYDDLMGELKCLVRQRRVLGPRVFEQGYEEVIADAFEEAIAEAAFEQAAPVILYVKAFLMAKSDQDREDFLMDMVGDIVCLLPGD